MGVSKVDIHKKSRRFEQDYALHTYEGVYSLLENLHYLRSERLKGSIEAAELLIDFFASIKKSSVSKREMQVLYYRYELQYTQKETAQELNLSRRTVQSYETRAIEKIANDAKYIWEE